VLLAALGCAEVELETAGAGGVLRRSFKKGVTKSATIIVNIIPTPNLIVVWSRSTLLIRSVRFLSFSLIFDNKLENDSIPPAIGLISFEGISVKPNFCDVSR